MKTSNKLIIAVGGWIVAMLLFSAIILRVNYSKGITNSSDTTWYRHSEAETAKPFKAIILENGKAMQNIRLTLIKDEVYTISGVDKDLFYYKGDTLCLKTSKAYFVTLTLPAITYIDQQGKIWDVNIQGFDDLPTLNIVATDGSYTAIENSKIQSLNYNGRTSNTLSIPESNKIDSADITLLHNSELTFEAENKYANMKLDSLNVLELKGNVLNSIKSIK